MITIKCAKCRARLFRYVKIGKGRVLHLLHDRIVEDISVRDGDEVRCQCGNVVGKNEKKWIKMRRSAFTYSGTIQNK